MKPFSYYAYLDEGKGGFNACSRESRAHPLMVNCAGFMSLCHPFTTYNRTCRADYYLMYIARGELLVGEEGADTVAREGDIIIFPPNYPYRYTFSGEGEIGYYFVHFTGSEVESTLSSLGLQSLPRVVRGGHSERAVRAFSEMFSAFSEENEQLDILLGGYLAVILSSLAGFGNERVTKRLTRSLQYINAYYTEPISVVELARLEALSPSRYSAVFRAETGVSPMRYIATLRVNHAMSLLASTDLDVGRIGETVGYADKHFFSKTFKKHTGLSPREYREARK